MASTLERMFVYAKTVAAHQRENFTTEALAGAIRSDPQPLFAALRARGIAFEDHADVMVETQVWLAKTGQLDMVVEFGQRAARRSVWIEVKVGAYVDLEQLDRYQRAPGGAKQVVLLARDPAPEPVANVRSISWQDIWAAIGDVASNAWWSEFKTYLEEIKMADPFLAPVTTEEGAALAHTAALLGKVACILKPFAVQARTVWPASNWKTTDLGSELFATLLECGSASLNSFTGDAGASAGARPHGEAHDPCLGLWVFTDPRRTQQGAERVCKQADQLDAAWERSAAGWEPLGVYRRLDSFKDPGEATAWLIAKLTELKTAGVLDLVAGLN